MNTPEEPKTPESPNDDVKYIFRRYITRNGKRIYSKSGKCFKIPVSKEKSN